MKMYYNAPGLFSISHLIFFLISLILFILLIYISKDKSNKEILLYIKIISIVVLILEILKIIWNILYRADKTYEDYIPLYLCSFFIYFSLIFSFTNENTKINYISKMLLFYIGISGGLAFTIYPTTTLLVFPLLHIISIHSLIYHVLMAVVGLWMLRFYKINIDDFKTYFKILLVIELIVVFINIIMDTNFMMLNKPYNIYILEFIYSISKDIYPFFMALVQIIITFFVPYTLIFLINKLKLIFYHKFFTKKR